jgi:DNA-binding phage protein
MTKKEIGKAIQKAKKNKTSYRVCKETALTTQQLHKMESGSSNYTIDSLMKLCNNLGLKIIVE